jgi:hypothetical protein
MKFRFVLLDPDGDSHRHTPPRENAAAAESADPAQAFRYQIRGTDMVRQERLADGRHRLIPVRGLARTVGAHLLIRHDEDFQVDIDAVQQRNADPGIDYQQLRDTGGASSVPKDSAALMRLLQRSVHHTPRRHTPHSAPSLQCLAGAAKRGR